MFGFVHRHVELMFDLTRHQCVIMPESAIESSSPVQFNLQWPLRIII